MLPPADILSFVILTFGSIFSIVLTQDNTGDRAKSKDEQAPAQVQ